MKFESKYNIGDEVYYVRFSKKQQKFLAHYNEVTYVRADIDDCGLIYIKYGLSRGHGCEPEDLVFKTRKEAFDFIEEMELNTVLLNKMREENGYEPII